MAVQYQEFQKLLRRAIGNRSNAEFCRQSGISYVQLYRMLNRPEEAGRPSIPSLTKIARSALDGVTYRELLTACGYSEAELDFYSDEQESAKGEKGKRVLLNRMDRIQACEKDIYEGFWNLTSIKGGAYSSLSDFIDDFEMFYAVEDLAYDLGPERKKPDGDKHNGSYYVNFNISWASGDKNNEAYHIIPGAIYYYKTDDGQYVVTFVAFSVKELTALGLVKGESMTEDFYNKKILTITREKFAKMEFTEDDMRTAENRVMSLIYEGEARYPDLVAGPGFEVTDNLPNIVPFLIAHEGTFVHTPFDEEVLNEVTSGEKSAWDAYAYYEDAYNSEEGLPAFLAMILREETSIPFSGWKEEAGDYCDNGADEKPHAYVLLEESYLESGKFHHDTALDLLFKYAVELGITEFGQKFFRTTRTIDYNDQYRIEKDANGDTTYHQIPFEEVRKRYPKNRAPLVESALERVENAETILTDVAENFYADDKNGVAIRNAMDELKCAEEDLAKITEGKAV